MARSTSWNQVLLFGVLGALGCLAGAVLGEGWINAIQPLKPKDAAVVSVVQSPADVAAPRATTVQPVPPPTDPPADLTPRRKAAAPDPPPALKKVLAEAGAHVGFIEITL